MLIAEIISVGTELLLGEIIDTNAAFVAQELKTKGISIHWKTTVGDNLERIAEAVTRGISRSDIVILGGGLGPTDDDLTREAIAQVVGEKPTIDEIYLKQLRSFFESKGRTFPAANIKQAWVVSSGEALANPIGTAPGWYVVTKTGKIIIALPGPPREMKRMWHEQVLPRLALPESGLYTITFRTNAIGESHVAERLVPLTQSNNPSVATYAHRDGVHVRVVASSKSIDEAQKIASPIEQQIRTALANFIYGTDNETLPELIGNFLLEHNQSIATLESLTGGLIADELTNIPRASQYVVGGAITYTNDAKIRMGVQQTTISEHGAISAQTALEMARVAQKMFNSNWGLSTTGNAGPTASENKPVGTLFVGVVGPNFEKTFEFSSMGDRRSLKERAAFIALGQLWNALKETSKVAS